MLTTEQVQIGLLFRMVERASQMCNPHLTREERLELTLDQNLDGELFKALTKEKEPIPQYQSEYESEVDYIAGQ